MCLSISMIQSDEDSVPDEAAQVLAQLTKHEHVRGCVALTAACLLYTSDAADE